MKDIRRQVQRRSDAATGARRGHRSRRSHTGAGVAEGHAALRPSLARGDARPHPPHRRMSARPRRPRAASPRARSCQRLRRADQAEGPVAAAAHDDRHDVRRRRPVGGLVALTCLGGYLTAGGAGAVNHWFDRDIDAQMARTATRPIPAGRVSPRAALLFGCALAALSVIELSLTVNLLAASLSSRASSATCSSTRCGSSAARRRTS